MIQTGQWCAFFAKKLAFAPFPTFQDPNPVLHRATRCRRMLPRVVLRSFGPSPLPWFIPWPSPFAPPCHASHVISWRLPGETLTAVAPVVQPSFRSMLQFHNVPHVFPVLCGIYMSIYTYIVSHMKSRDFKIFNFSWMAVSLFIFGHRNEMTIPHDSYFWVGWHKHQPVSTKKRFWINLIPLK